MIINVVNYKNIRPIIYMVYCIFEYAILLYFTLKQILKSLIPYGGFCHEILRSYKVPAGDTGLYRPRGKRQKDTQDVFNEKYQSRRALGGYHEGHPRARAGA